MTSQALWRWLKVPVVSLAALILPIGAYGLWVNWQMRELSALCAAIQPGEPLEALASRIERAGFGAPALGEGGVPDPAQPGVRVLLVPAPATMGEVACVIQTQGARVLTAQMDGP